MRIAHHLIFSCDILFNNSLTSITQPTYHLKLPLGNHMQKIQEVAICMAGHLSALAVEDRHFTLIVYHLNRKGAKGCLEKHGFEDCLLGRYKFSSVQMTVFSASCKSI